MSLDHLLRCPACGPFGVRRRRRERDAADQLHINWARHLAADSRRRRADADGLIAVTDCRVLPLPPGRYERTVKLPAMSLHSHAEGQPCDEDCRHYPASETTEVTDILPEPDPASVERLSRVLRNQAAQQQREIEAYDTDDVVAEVIGPLSYEEQSEMIGDPIADVIKKETE